MSASWIIEKQSEIYTVVKYRAEKVLKPKYPDIRFTMDDSAQLEAQFPTVYVHYLPGREIARDIEGDNINAFVCDVQVDVTVSKAQGKTVAEKVSAEIMEQFKKLRFDIRSTPTPVSTGNETKQMSFRMSRTIGSSDE